MVATGFLGDKRCQIRQDGRLLKGNAKHHEVNVSADVAMLENQGASYLLRYLSVVYFCFVENEDGY